MATYTKEQLKDAKLNLATAKKAASAAKKQYEQAARAEQRAQDKLNKMTTPQQ